MSDSEDDRRESSDTASGEGEADSEAAADGPERGRIAAAAEDVRRPLPSLLRDGGRGNLRWLGAGAASSVAAQFLSNLDMFIVGLAFDAMFNGMSYDLPLVPAGWIPADPTGMLAFTVALLVGLKLVDMTFGIFAEYALFLFAQRTLHRIRVDAFDRVQRLDMGFFDTQQTGEVMSVLNNDVNSLEQFLEVGPNLGVVAVAMFASSVVYMALLNWQLALISVAVAPVLLAANVWFGARHEARNDDVREETGILNALLETNISGIQTVKAFGGERHETERVTDRSATHRTASWRAHMVGVGHQPALRMLAGVAFVATLFVGTEWAIDSRFWLFPGTITAGELVPFMYYTQQLVMPVRFLAWVTGLYKGATSSAKRILGVQRMEPPREEGRTELVDPEGRVEYEDVSFAYPGTDERVLSDIDLDVEPGETVGLVGETGAGKSTLLKLLQAYYDPGEGSVRVDGTDVREITRDSLRTSIGYVAQDPFLFTGTIRENIAYAVSEADRREASEDASSAEQDSAGRSSGRSPREDGDSRERGDPTDEDIEAAAREAGAHEFIGDLEKGYDAEVGERGVMLSGGQRQRIALARVLLADPPMFIFDEATSHVDNRTEVLIQRSLDAVTEDRTTFVVAHRLSTVRDADRIVVMDDGRIVEQGTHDELLDLDGKYADLWKVQVGAVGT
ncbi:ABC transporter ATP-binding protein [Halosimplex rubrum]|uniref:ABC transporter ATP-binding protein n=1 Tax=Halosimplex rubrum TaxID=869889 RepID=A0A7D5T2S5_9EURY|nr:ABC transporter ATP-binding protein [Halosimplex rubrum]QLH76270.1 ABC transporter ATP-binding protein [Halosimplex rubrum]